MPQWRKNLFRSTARWLHIFVSLHRTSLINCELQRTVHRKLQQWLDVSWWNRTDSTSDAHEILMWRRVYRIVVVMVVRFRWAPFTWGGSAWLRIAVVSYTSTMLALGYLAWWTWCHQSVDVYHWHHSIRPAIGPEFFASALERLLLYSGRQTVAKWFGFSPFLHSLPRAWALISWLVLATAAIHTQLFIPILPW
jgi:hypothetical protein